MLCPYFSQKCGPKCENLTKTNFYIDKYHFLTIGFHSFAEVTNGSVFKWNHQGVLALFLSSAKLFPKFFNWLWIGKVVVKKVGSFFFFSISHMLFFQTGSFFLFPRRLSTIFVVWDDQDNAYPSLASDPCWFSSLSSTICSSSWCAWERTILRFQVPLFEQHWAGQSFMTKNWTKKIGFYVTYAHFSMQLD